MKNDNFKIPNNKYNDTIDNNKKLGKRFHHKEHIQK